MQRYGESNKYSPLFVTLSPFLQVLKTAEHPVANLLPHTFYDAYEGEEFIIKFVAVGVLSGSASFHVWTCK
jgi:hypothetical protein